MRHPPHRPTAPFQGHDEPLDGQSGEPRDERLATIRGQQQLAELAARAEMERRDSPYYADTRVVDWLAREVESPHRASEGWSRAQIRAAAARLRAKVEAARLKVRLAGAPPVERAPVAGMIADVLDVARARHFAPQLELGAAAGVGRDLWDEPCEQWVRIPDDTPAGSYVSLRVVGESMDPLLHTGDSVLVQVGAAVARDTVVLARVPDAGYVVKRVGRVTRAELELQSLNDAFPPIVVPRDERTVVGTVVLRWCPHTSR
ncbi:MAG: S24 family peptidase [Gemmatimonadetes bacterium]|nr:S24 family peptidase [Gemmatimonadota bacterium]